MNVKLSQELESADVIFKRGRKGLFTKAIKWFTRKKNESKTVATHVAMIINYHNSDNGVYVIEALWTVTITPFDEWKDKNPNFSIWRMKNLNADERRRIADDALNYHKNFYGVFKILMHGADCLLEKIFDKDIFLFRRLQFLNRYPICSWLVSYVYYNVLRYSFGMSPKFTDPDSMNDYVRKSEDFKMIQLQVNSKREFDYV